MPKMCIRDRVHRERGRARERLGEQDLRRACVHLDGVAAHEPGDAAAARPFLERAAVRHLEVAHDGCLAHLEGGLALLRLVDAEPFFDLINRLRGGAYDLCHDCLLCMG